MAAASDTKRERPLRLPITLGVCFLIAIAGFFFVPIHNVFWRRWDAARHTSRTVKAA